MENKNLIIAIVLSTSILLGWSLFFENPEKINEQNQKQTEKKLKKKPKRKKEQIKQFCTFFKETKNRN